MKIYRLSFASLAAVLALALTALSCAPARPPATAAGLPSLDVPDLEIRSLLLLLVDQQTLEPLVVDQALRGGPALRETLAESLGRIPDDRGVTTLSGLLIDDVPAVRRAAAFALGELEYPAGRDALLKALADSDRETGALALEALGKIGGTPVVDVAEGLLSLPEEERWARLLPYLFRFKEEATVRLAERGLMRTDPEEHARAAYALARDPRPEALPILRTLLADPDPRVRGWAARALGLIGEAGDVERLRPLLDDSQPGPIVQALRASKSLLGRHADAAAPAGWRPRLVQLLADPRPGVRVTAVEAVSPWVKAAPDDALAQALLARAAEGPAPAGLTVLARERGLALTSLAAARHPRALERVRAAATADDPDLRARAAEAAGELGAGDVLEKLSSDPQAMVRSAALGIRLSAFDATPEKGAELAAAILKDPDVGVRGTALGWVSEHPVVPLETLEPAVTSALRDPDDELGLSAVQAVAARAEAEPHERGALIALLEKIATVPAYSTRRAAGEALGQLGQRVPYLGPAPTGRPQTAYREIVQRTWRPRTVEIRTSQGPFRVRLACPQAPLTCLNFLQLASQGYFNGLRFHRVVPDFVVQGGDPKGDGSGGPGYSIRDEINRLRYDRGAVGMALAGPDTGGSQFFVTLSQQPHLDGGYTAFGEVVSGMEVVDRLAVGDGIEGIVEVEEASRSAKPQM
jgi:cyclophilin family peptidyl-prolyl cis-trans isomerase/HEAT repeat protein